MLQEHRHTPLYLMEVVAVLLGQGFQPFCITETAQSCHSADGDWITAISELIVGFHALTPAIHSGTHPSRERSTTLEDETGGLFRPYGIAFGPNGNLYVSSFLRDQILVYHGDSGEFLSVFSQGDQQPGGLNGPNGLLFNDQVQLYVTPQGSVAINGVSDFSFGLPSQVLIYDLKTGSSTVFATPDPSPDSFGFVSLLGLAFAPQGKYKGETHILPIASRKDRAASKGSGAVTD